MCKQFSLIGREDWFIILYIIKERASQKKVRKRQMIEFVNNKIVIM